MSIQRTLKNAFYDVTLFMTKLFYRLYFRFEVRGRENIPREGGVVIISNHASWLDPPLVSISLPRRTRFLAKEELFRIPVFGSMISAYGAIPIKRAGVDRKAISACRRALKEGEALLIFPEGTRTKTGDLQKLKPGAAMIVGMMKNVTVIPAWIDGSFEAMPRGRNFPRPLKLRIRFGPPVKLPEKGVEIDKKDYYKTSSNLFSEALNCLKNSENHHS